MEFAHIIPWSAVQEHTFENMIVLCAVDHHRYDHGEIDRQTMRMYKSNLALLNNRYSDFERRVLQYLADRGRSSIELSPGHEIHLLHLVRDGMLHHSKPPNSGSLRLGMLDPESLKTTETFSLTLAGFDLIQRWRSADQIDPISKLD